mmetsp:Transcript_34696/g.69086  ORF Transcript_34696/g.69086 Transcript_34696/m.69086 type:complete len:84 (-) Transcript_34696:353-604(-)
MHHRMSCRIVIDGIATCNMPHAASYMRQVTCNMPHATCRPPFNIAQSLSGIICIYVHITLIRAYLSHGVIGASELLSTPTIPD